MQKLINKTKFNIKQLTAIERIAADPGYKTKQLAEDLKVEQETIRTWKNNINFISAVYDRFMDIAGKHMPDVILAQIREAKAGNTQAATLVLKHFGKFQDTITIKVEAPFNQFLKSRDIEDAEIIKDDAIEIGNSFEIPENILSDRDPINDLPKTRVRRENKKIKKIYSRQKYLDNRNERYHWLKRAKKVGIDPMGRGKPSPEKLRAWHDSIVKAENDLANGITQDIQKSPK
jgi:uncharacterized protein YjcR